MDLWSSHRSTDMTVEQAIGLLEAEQVRRGRRPANLAALGVLAVSAIVTAVGLG